MYFFGDEIKNMSKGQIQMSEITCFVLFLYMTNKVKKYLH